MSRDYCNNWPIGAFMNELTDGGACRGVALRERFGSWGRNVGPSLVLVANS